MQGGELRSSLPDARPTANRLVMPPDLGGRRAEVEGGEERPEIFPSERRQGGGCCGFPNAKSEERNQTNNYYCLMRQTVAAALSITSVFAGPSCNVVIDDTSDVDSAYQNSGGSRVTGMPFATRSPALARHGMAATSQPLSTQVALDILKVTREFSQQLQHPTSLNIFDIFL